MRRRMAGLWLPVVVYMAAIFVLSSLPSLPQPPGVTGLDKPEHYIAYAGLAILAVRALRGARPGWSLSAVAALAILISAGYGVTDELHQRFVPTRCCDVFDWMADLIGSVSGAGLASMVIYLRHR